MVLTVAGSRRTRHAIVLRTALQDARATLYKARREDIEPGQPVEITLRDAPIFTGVVTAVQRDYRHVIIDARAAMLHTMATETVSAIMGDSRKASEIAPEILGVDPRFDGGTDIVLPRWGCREGRLMRWAWESLMRTLSARMGQPIAWRYDARADLVIIEPNRDAWEGVEPGIARRREGNTLIYDAVDVQAGDALPSGELVEMTTTLWKVRKRYTRAHVVAA